MSKRDCAVSPKKEPRKQSKKPKKIIVFSTENKNKFKIKLKMAALCYASKKPIHKTYIITSSRCFHEKKNQTQNTEPEIIWLCTTRKTDRKNNPNPWIRTTPSITVFLFVDVSFSPKKKYPVAPWQKEMNELTHTLPKVPRKINYYTCSALKFNAGFILHKFVQLNAEDFRILAKRHSFLT